MRPSSLRPRAIVSRALPTHFHARLWSSRRPSPSRSSHRVLPPPLRPASRSQSLILASHIQARGKKTKASVSLDDLPQGLLPLEPLPLERDDPGPVYPTVVQQARNHMRKFDNCVLLTRVGGFYELYFEHADQFGDLLGLKVVQTPASNAPPFSKVSNLRFH